MARKDSPLYNFIMDALLINKYPYILYWIDKNEGIFCLKCLCKSKREWNPSHSKIFDDYHKLKPRKSNDRRQRFLVAMRHCPFIEPLDDISSKEEKFYKFRTHGTLSVNATDEIAALSALNQHHETDEIPSVPPALSGPPIVNATDDIAVLSALNQRVEMEEIPFVPTAENGPPIVNATTEIAVVPQSNQDVEMEEISAVWTVESGPPTGINSMEDIACDSEPGNGLDNSLNPMETDSNCSSLNDLDKELGPYIDDWLQNSDGTRSDIEDLLEKFSSDDLELPDIGPPMSPSRSFYGPPGLVSSLPSCSQDPGSSELSNLQKEERSYHFGIGDKYDSVPFDYDPAMDFMKSMRAPKAVAVNPSTVAKADPTQLRSVQMLPGSSGEPSNYQSSVRVFELDDNDGIVKSLRGDNVEKKFYMMVLNPGSM